MTAFMPLDPDTGLPGAAHLLDALGRDPSAASALEVVAALMPEGIDEPFAVAADLEEGRRCGMALEEVAGHHDGSAYRLSGNAFALLLPPQVPAGTAASFAQRALAAAAPRFEESVVHARVEIPGEAPPTRAALQLALERLRARAAWHPLAPGRQARDVLLELLQERCAPGDQVRHPKIAGHAVALGRRLGMTSDQLDDLVRAAELQDVGMLVLQSTLGKRGPLDDEDWAVIRHHPVVGERVVGASPALRRVAAIVRACYERWDGSGYPDGLRGDMIPMSARVIAVCVAFAAMTSRRPHRPALSSGEAMRELEKCAGSQFDPAVVGMFPELIGFEAPLTARLPVG